MDLVITATILFIIFTVPTMTAATAGFILAFAGSISGETNWLLIQLRNFELYGVSLERTAEYRHLELEDDEPLQGDDGGASRAEVAPTGRDLTVANWPTKGSLQVEELSARYGPELPEILHKISFTVEGGQRVGIVGSTGYVCPESFLLFLSQKFQSHLPLDRRGGSVK